MPGSIARKEQGGCLKTQLLIVILRNEVTKDLSFGGFKELLKKDPSLREAIMIINEHCENDSKNHSPQNVSFCGENNRKVDCFLYAMIIMLNFAELMGATHGMGYYIQNSITYANYTQAVAGIICIGIVVTLLSKLVTLIQRKAIRWR